MHNTTGRAFELNEQTLSIIEEIGGHMPGGFFIYKAEQPEDLIYANKAIFDIYGCNGLEEFKELTGFTFRGMVHPEDYDAISGSIIQQINDSEDKMDYAEYRIIRKDGEIRWVDDYGHYADTKAYGGVYVVFISDITEKKEQRDTDTATRDAVIATLTNSYNTVWLINDVVTESCSLYHSDMDAAHTEAIRNALSHAKYTDTKTEYVATMVAEEDQERMQIQIGLPYILEQFKTKDQFSVSFIRTLESGQRYYRVDFGKVHMPGGRIGVTMGFKDVDDEVRKDQELQRTLRDAMEAANASSKAKSDFLASMSHDMRTPMNGIIGMTAIAATHLDDRERVADCLKKITDSSAHLLALINEVLDMNKIESGKIDLLEEDFDLAELVDSVLAMTRPQVEARGHNLNVHIGEVAHEKVVGDSTRIREILVNLLSNAIKYTPEGGRIVCTVEERHSNIPDIGLFEFTIEDNGIGIKPEFLPHVFDPFARAEDKAAQAQQGTGLGLAITRNLARMMGGDIQVESTYGKGSKFTATVYLRLQESDSVVHEEFVDLHVLVADDDPISCESACCILNDLGMNSEWALSGKAAVERVVTRHEQRRDFYAVILDWRMPDLSGVETTRQIRKAVGEDMPIIVISAYDWSDIETEARDAGVSAFISKPLFRTKFVRVFQSLMEQEKEDSEETPLKKLEELRFENKRILLAEDNPINAEIAIHILQMTGLMVDHAEDGREAYEKFRDAQPGKYSLIFMDIQMPHMNGYDAAVAIRNLGTEEAAKIPIIAMTANAFEEDKQNAFKAGMNAHIAKPLNFDELSALLQEWI
ncbi:MAG: response regulator [Lachnospiraceae bacterium]|nr:response regulator [Lachnospiraceae bacterium]